MSNVDPQLLHLVRQLKQNIQASRQVVERSIKDVSQPVHRIAGHSRVAWETEAGRYLSADEVAYLQNWDNTVNGQCVLDAVLTSSDKRVPFSAVVFFSAGSNAWRYGYSIPKGDPFVFSQGGLKYTSAALAKLAFLAQVAAENYTVVSAETLSLASKLAAASNDQVVPVRRRFSGGDDPEEPTDE